jgi:hypothetical protein
MGDFNGDFHVNVLDATILAANWGATSGAAEGNAVPEPSTLIVLLAGLVSILSIRSGKNRS